MEDAVDVVAHSSHIGNAGESPSRILLLVFFLDALCVTWPQAG